MASAKQIAWRKKFAKMAKSGKFKKSKSAKRTSRTVKTGKMKGWDVEITGTSYAKKSELPQRIPTKPKAVDPKDYGTSKDIHQIPQGMLDELYQSKVRGFPFFVYTGIKDYLLMGNDSLMLKDIPPNPNKISAIQINYDKGADGFTIDYYVGNNRVADPQILYVGDLADAIVQKMGVW